MKIKLSKKQKAVIAFMRTGKEIYWSNGYEPTAGFSGGGMELSTATFYKLKDMGIIEKTIEPKEFVSLMDYYILTDFGKTVAL